MARMLEKVGDGVYRVVEFEDHVPEAPEACCRMPGNVLVAPGHPDARPDMLVRVCVVCGRRHLVLTVDPGRLGLIGAPVAAGG